MANILGITSGVVFPYLNFVQTRPAQALPPGPRSVGVEIGGPGNDSISIGGGVGPAGPVGPAGSPGSSILTVTDVTTAAYTALPADEFLCANVSPATITLPVSVIGKTYIVKDCTGAAQTNPIAIAGTAVLIDGSATATIDINYGSLTFVFNGTEWSIT